MLKVILDNLFSNNKDVSIKTRQNFLYINTWSDSYLAIGTVLRRTVNNSSTYKDSSWFAWNFYAEPGGAITVLNENIFAYSIFDIPLLERRFHANSKWNLLYNNRNY